MQLKLYGIESGQNLMKNEKLQINENLLLYRTEIKVRADDLNYGNHLSNSRLLVFLDQIRLLFLTQHNQSELNCFGFSLMITKTSINYLSQGFFNHHLEINLYLENFSHATVEFGYTIFNKTTLKNVAKAKTSQIFFDQKEEKITKVPYDFKKILIPFRP